MGLITGKTIARAIYTDNPDVPFFGRASCERRFEPRTREAMGVEYRSAPRGTDFAIPQEASILKRDPPIHARCPYGSFTSVDVKPFLGVQALNLIIVLQGFDDPLLSVILHINQ